MQCRNCGTEIADKALICYKCGTATTEAKYQPAPLPGGRRVRASSPTVIALALLVAVALVRRARVDHRLRALGYLRRRCRRGDHHRPPRLRPPPIAAARIKAGHPPERVGHAAAASAA